MAKPKSRKKRKGKIKIRKSVRLVRKNDATRVGKTNVDPLPTMPTQMPRTAAPVFKVKIRRKHD